jgi:hypothetical protein
LCVDGRTRGVATIHVEAQVLWTLLFAILDVNLRLQLVRYAKSELIL